MEHLRPADRDAITGQPLFCPQCGSSLGANGHCSAGDWIKCHVRDEADYVNGRKPFPDYNERVKQ